jgi:hypothetical protein
VTDATALKRSNVRSRTLLGSIHFDRAPPLAAGRQRGRGRSWRFLMLNGFFLFVRIPMFG